jgi:hypothetical protein
MVSPGAQRVLGSATPLTSITIRLPEELKDRLNARSRLSGKSCSALVRTWLEKELSQSKLAHGKRQSVLDKLADLVGKGDSGIANLATDSRRRRGYGRWRD